jgi:hypothetical protein
MQVPYTKAVCNNVLIATVTDAAHSFFRRSRLIISVIQSLQPSTSPRFCSFDNAARRNRDKRRALFRCGRVIDSVGKSLQPSSPRYLLSRRVVAIAVVKKYNKRCTMRLYV